MGQSQTPLRRRAVAGQVLSPAPDVSLSLCHRSGDDPNVGVTLNPLFSVITHCVADMLTAYARVANLPFFITRVRPPRYHAVTPEPCSVRPTARARAARAASPSSSSPMPSLSQSSPGLGSIPGPGSGFCFLVRPYAEKSMGRRRAGIHDGTASWRWQ